MKVLYKQDSIDAKANSKKAFGIVGIKDCYLKQLIVSSDDKRITKKVHHHNAYEVQILTEGHQLYKIDNKFYRLEKGKVLIIPPYVQHRIVESAQYTVKYSITFIRDDEKNDIHTSKKQCYFGALNPHVMDNINFVVSELNNRTTTSEILVANRVLETVVLLLRSIGYEEKTKEENPPKENFHLTLAKQYIKDNIREALKLLDVSVYCHLSNKQLTRIFEYYENISPALYIRRQKIKVIEKVLLESKKSLKEISEEFNFSSEYYFNAFFKKHTGMSPGEYKKMHKDELLSL